MAKKPETGTAEWCFDQDAGAWYVALDERARPPYLHQREVNAILDIDDNGRLAGIEILEPILPPLPSCGDSK